MAMYGASAYPSAAETAAAYGMDDSKTGYLSGYTPLAATKSGELSGGRQYVVRARGLPWSVTDDEIAEFFEPEIVLRTREQIHRHELNGRFSGEIYLELYTQEEQTSAVAKNRRTMGKRYLEVFASTASELKKAMENTGTEKKENILKMRGLPFHVTRDEILKFLEGCELKGEAGAIHFVPDRNGRGTCNGEAFIEMADDSSMDRALAKNKQTIGQRWIEVFRSTQSEMESIIYPDVMDPYGMYTPHGYDMYGGPGMRGGMRGGRQFGPPRNFGPPPPPPVHDYGPAFRVKMQGLPYETSRHDVIQFFHPAEVLFLEFVRDNSGRITDCVVEFGNERDHQLALSRHKQHMGRRYVEVYAMEDDTWYAPPHPPYGGGGPGGYYPPPEIGMAEHRIHMRGVPFDVTNAEIYEFFGTINVTGVDFNRDRQGKVQDVFVTFGSQRDYDEAMRLNRTNIRHRYIELYDAGGMPGGGPMRGGRPMRGNPMSGRGRPDYGGFS